MAASRPDSGFSVARDRGSARYEVSGEGIGFLMKFAVLLVAFLISTVPSGILQSHVPTIIVLLAVYGVLYLISKRMKRPVWITIEPHSVVVMRGETARTYERNQIRGLSLQNDAQKRVVYNSELRNGHFIMVGSGIAGTAAVGFAAVTAGLNRAATQTGKAIGNAAAAEMANRSWSVKIQYGSKHVTLANHLKQAKAETLYADIARSLQEI